MVVYLVYQIVCATGRPFPANAAQVRLEPMKTTHRKAVKPQHTTLEEKLSHALLVHEDTMKVVTGEKRKYNYTAAERRDARKLIMKCAVGKPEVIQ